jgi:hypothetical protein
MAGYCISCKNQQHVKKWEGRIWDLENKLKAIREETFKLKTGNFNMNNKFSIMTTDAFEVGQ